MPWAPAIFSGLGLAVAAPWLLDATPVWKRIVPVLALGAVTAAAIGCVGVAFSAREPAVDSLLYGMDADTGDARWVTFDDPPPAWVAESVPHGSPRAVLTSLTRWGAPLANARAEPIHFAPARVEAVPGPGGDVEVRIEPREAVRCVDLWHESGAPVRAVSVNGKAIRSVVRFSPEFDAKAMRWATGDQSREGWHLEHCGFSMGPFRLVLAKLGAEATALRIVERRDGLPVGPRQRDPWLVPRQDGDVTLVSQALRLP
jgi:hypothetical protein